MAGTQALGRGAFYARVRDFMAVWQNPANLALSPKRNVGLNFRVPMFDACFKRQEDPTKTYFDGDVPFQKVCNEAAPMPTGSLGFAMPIRDHWGFGAGVYVPAGVGHLKFGNDTSYTKSPVNPSDPAQQLPTTQPGSDVPKSSPGRWLLLERELLSAFLMAGVGYAPLPQLRVGLSAGMGFASIHYRSVAGVSAGDEGAEFLNDIQAVDGFIPRVTASIGSTPLQGLDLSAVFTFNDDVHASGDVDVTANGLQGAELGDCRAEPDPGGDGLKGPGTRCRVDNAKVNSPYQRYQLMLAVRYGMQRDGQALTGDPMQDEVFDVELNAYWEQTSHVESLDLVLYDPAESGRLPSINTSSASSGVQSVRLPNVAGVPHNWRDTYGVRVGGDYNVLPGLLAVRTGVAYETQGTPDSTMGLDFWPVQKVVLHLGGTVRAGPVDIHLAYAHSFNTDVNVPVGTGEVPQVVALGEAATGKKPWAVNEGRFTSKLNVLALGATYNF